MVGKRGGDGIDGVISSAVGDGPGVVEKPLDGNWRWFAVHHTLECRVYSLVNVDVGYGLDLWDVCG